MPATVPEFIITPKTYASAFHTDRVLYLQVLFLLANTAIYGGLLEGGGTKRFLALKIKFLYPTYLKLAFYPIITTKQLYSTI